MKKKLFLAAGLAAVLAAAGMFWSCDNKSSPLGDIAEQCGLTCVTLAEGRADITGNASIDSFFDSVLTLNNAALDVNAQFQAELDKLAVALKCEATPAGIKAALKAKMDASIDGGVTLVYDPPKCEANLDIAVKAAAKCDADVKPGKVEASCSGKCEVQASADCKGDCSVQGPSVQCTGSCKGECKLDAAASCEGGCKGTCTLDVAAKCEGTCKGTCSGTCSATDDQGNCAGNCDGNCQGTCEMAAAAKCSGSCSGSCNVEAGASCSGSCKGECTMTQPSGKCEGTCSATASGSCSGSCSGKAEPPKVKAECDASVKAKANANVTCTPPQLDFGFNFKADATADAQAEFEALIPTLKASISGILAVNAKAKILVDLFADMTTAAGGAVKGAVSADFSDPIAAFKMACGVAELPAAGTMLSDSATSVKATVSGEVTLIGAFAGSKTRAEW